MKIFNLSEDLDFFNTPMLQYLSMKKAFLEIFPDIKAWGEFGSKKKVIAIASLLDYFEKTRNLADQFPQLSYYVLTDNNKLVLEHILPFSSKLYQQLLAAAVEGSEDEYNSLWQQPSSVTLAKIENFLVRKRISCLAAYEDKVWS